MRRILVKASLVVILMTSMISCKFEPHIEPLILPTAPPQPFATFGQTTTEQIPTIESQFPGRSDLAVLGKRDAKLDHVPGWGAVGFIASVMALSLAGLRHNRLGPCIANGVLTITNGVGTLLLATGVGVEIGAGLLAINLVAQVFQIASDRGKQIQGAISPEHFNFNLALNIIDMIPGLGVLSGIFGLMGTCVFDWAFEFSPTSPDRR